MRDGTDTKRSNRFAWSFKNKPNLTEVLQSAVRCVWGEFRKSSHTIPLLSLVGGYFTVIYGRSYSHEFSNTTNPSPV